MHFTEKNGRNLWWEYWQHSLRRLPASSERGQALSSAFRWCLCRTQKRRKVQKLGAGKVGDWIQWFCYCFYMFQSLCYTCHCTQGEGGSQMNGLWGLQSHHGDAMQLSPRIRIMDQLKYLVRFLLCWGLPEVRWKEARKIYDVVSTLKEFMWRPDKHKKTFIEQFNFELFGTDSNCNFKL